MRTRLDMLVATVVNVLLIHGDSQHEEIIDGHITESEMAILSLTHPCESMIYVFTPLLKESGMFQFRVLRHSAALVTHLIIGSDLRNRTTNW